MNENNLNQQPNVQTNIEPQVVQTPVMQEPSVASVVEQSMQPVVPQPAQPIVQQPVTSTPVGEPNNNTPKKSKVGLIIVIVLIVAVIAVLGVYFFVNKDDKKNYNEQNNTAVNQENKKENNDGNNNFDENSEDKYKLITIGHVDHGKTTLVSAISKQYGNYISVDDLNITTEIKKNNVIFNVSNIEFKTNKRNYILYDMPEHSDIVRGLLSGTIIPDGAILVVSATDGPMPQTREHLMLLNSIGIKNIVVYLNKCDLVDNSDLTSLVEMEISELLSEYGFDGDNTCIIKGSALKAIDGDKSYKETINKLINEIDKFSNSIVEKEVTTSAIEAEVYVLSKEEGGRHTPFFSEYKPQIVIDSLNLNSDIELPDGVEMVMPGDNVSIKFSLEKTVSVKIGDKIQIKEDGKIVGVGVISNTFN